MPGTFLKPLRFPANALRSTPAIANSVPTPRAAGPISNSSALASLRPPVRYCKKPLTACVAANSFKYPITERITLPRICSCRRNLSTNLPISIIAFAALSIAIIEASKALTRSSPFNLINFSS